jgi:hypothetical protein
MKLKKIIPPICLVFASLGSQTSVAVDSQTLADELVKIKKINATTQSVPPNLATPRSSTSLPPRQPSSNGK